MLAMIDQSPHTRTREDGTVSRGRRGERHRGRQGQGQAPPRLYPRHGQRERRDGTRARRIWI